MTATIHVIGFASSAAANPFAAVVAAVVAVVAAICAAACAVVAAALAVDAAVSAVSAAVFATIFAITFGIASRINLYPSTAFLTPDDNFPTTTAAGPTAATNAPTLMVVCFCPSSS